MMKKREQQHGTSWKDGIRVIWMIDSLANDQLEEN